MNAIDEFAARYVAIWNERSEAKRNAGVASLWSADARAYTSANEYIGLDAITQRVAATYEKFGAVGGFPIQLRPAPQAHHDGIRMHWQTGPASGDPVSAGTQFLVLHPDGRIRLDYQYTDF